MQRTATLFMLGMICTACTAAISGSAAHSLSMNPHMMLVAHNGVRASLNLPRLQWSERLSAYAQVWATTLASRYACRMQHRNEVGQDEWQVGENLFWAGARHWSDGRREVEPINSKRVADLWASEARDYDYASNQCRAGAQCGHYTQMVWRDTQELGCAAALCGDLGQIWVCNYSPSGNWLGQQPY